MTRAVASLLHQWFVELPPGAGMDARPAVFAVILQTGDVGTEEGGELPTTACALALITHLIIQHIWLHFHLDPKRKDREKRFSHASSRFSVSSVDSIADWYLSQRPGLDVAESMGFRHCSFIC